MKKRVNAFYFLINKVFKNIGRRNGGKGNGSIFSESKRTQTKWDGFGMFNNLKGFGRP